MNIHEELQDDALSDGGEDDLSPEDYGKHILCTLLGISDLDIKETLYHYYFDVQASLNWLYEEQQKREAARERRDHDQKPLPLLPGEEYDNTFYPHHRVVVLPPGPSEPQAYDGNPDNLDPDDYYEYSESSSSEFAHRTLSRITEVSEHSENSRDWPPPPATLPSQISRSTWSSETDYGQIIESRHIDFIDPNLIPPSPTPSALQRLSRPESPPSASSSGSLTPTVPSPKPPPESVDTSSPPPAPVPRSIPLMDTTPKGSLLFQKAAPSTTSTTDPIRSVTPSDRASTAKPRSKLSSLASSRASTSSRSSVSYTTDSSFVTYPILRPSPESILSASSEVGRSEIGRNAARESVVGSSVGRGNSGGQSQDRRSQKTASLIQSTVSESDTGISSMSSHVRRAIETALQLEAVDVTPSPRQQSPLASEPKAPSPPPQPLSKPTSPLARATSPRSLLRQSTTSPPPRKSPSPVKSPTVASSPPLASPPPANSPPLAKSPTPSGKSSVRTASAAQQEGKVKKLPQSPTPGLTFHTTHTEYLTPIANGPTATTAITTTYQSLSDLSLASRMAPTSSALAADQLRSPTTSKPSKLAMKSRKVHQRVEPEPEEQPPPQLQADLEMFSPKASRSRASPSAFVFTMNGVESKRSKGDKDKSDKPKRRKSHRAEASLPPAPPAPVQGFGFDVPSPDDIVFNARRGTSLAQRPSSASPHPSTSKPSLRSASSKASAAKEREKAQRLAQQKKAAEANARLPSAPPTPKKSAKKSGTSTPVRGADPRMLDLAALNLTAKEEVVVEEPPPKITIAREKVLEEARKALENKDDKKAVSLVVIGHVDAGKSTLMGRLLYELGRVDEKTRAANERASSKVGKSSFSWAWELDGTTEERERGITMDIALQNLSTPHRQITILDAPGHKDFIPNMISGASQADCALLVVDASTGEFEAGFEKGGQSREHLLLVRSLGVSQVIVAINKLDMVQWSKARYNEICGLLKPFLIQSGFPSSKFKFVPVGAMAGVNLVNKDSPEAQNLRAWYKGPTLVDLLDKLEPPTRDINAPLRFPIANVFKGQQSGIAVSGRICGGLVQVGERLRVLPGDETAVVRSIESETESLQWAASGSNVTLYLTAIDPIHVNIGSVLCPPTDVVPLASVFTARIIVFEIQVPITIGASVELYHHSKDVPASISKLISTLDRATGGIIKKNPRVLAKSASAEVQLTLRSTGVSGPTARAQPIPLEPFSVNKEMGRVLIRRGGETIAAGIVTGIVS
ncbi:hypothetical protein NLI96_g5250 [Meripilus lineatus]|uniref:Elongation factor 1 alpha-like protein n=1 Tax=Meripilus lineatus TaxID=2056292 RepID=A0AAD5YH39_9APHY|nr:hypothetical protein NLI96_g5250 [Physisporinus lineatus]